MSVPVNGRSMSRYWILVLVPPTASTSSTPSVTCTVAVPVVERSSALAVKFGTTVLPSTLIRCTESKKSGSPTPTVTL